LNHPDLRELILDIYLDFPDVGQDFAIERNLINKKTGGMR